jgi:hypothetical protein
MTGRTRSASDQQQGLQSLVQARDEFTANIEFGLWCDSNGFGADVLNHQTRAAAIAKPEGDRTLWTLGGLTVREDKTLLRQICCSPYWAAT